MSLNLTLECTETGLTQHLWQTPTYITDMCLYPPDSPKEDVFRRYCFWVRSLSNGVWNNKEDLDYRIQDIRNHIKEVEEFLSKHPKAVFSYV